MYRNIFTIFTLTAFIPVIIGMAVVGCGTPNRDENTLQGSLKESDATVNSGKDTLVAGQELFRRNCAGCHGLNREGKPPVFPSLLNIKEKMNEEQVSNQIKTGKGLMISHAHLPDNEINSIIAYLFNEPEQQITIDNYSPVDLGKSIVESNCMGCHRLTVNDPLPPNVKTLCPLVEPSAFVGEKKPLTLEEFRLILKTGPCYMPSFAYLTENEKEAIWSYIKTLEERFEKFK